MCEVCLSQATVCMCENILLAWIFLNQSFGAENHESVVKLEVLVEGTGEGADASLLCVNCRPHPVAYVHLQIPVFVSFLPTSGVRC